ncbi:homeodomain-interacting protein kinase 1-like [Scomber japonicus]|uniref:homeodomain-interacting protein kinase 1-like n=1 Tax=Scomber japonicus TaxID=13676 RepID=UPI00230545E6|nr:homeodomain-interacting protein kinase 1-like [Scomber japonicus]
MFKRIFKKKNKLPSSESQLPKNYELVTVLGKGVFGEVLKCTKVDTKETVAVKIPQNSSELDDELTVLNYFKEMNLDNDNIVRFIDSFKLGDKKLALVFEMMEMTLRDFLMDQRNFTPLCFDEVRAIIEQSASGLKALKDINVIHSDLKLDNIMLNVQPLTVKLIDFGVAFHSRTAEQGDIHQPAHYRAPEVMLGLPFSEAIDMWSLGVVMGYIALGESLFPGFFDYDTVDCMVDLFGVPPDHLLCAGMYSKEYFVQDPAGQWRLKTREEFWDNNVLSYGRKLYHYRSLDEVENLDLVDMREVDVQEKRMCIDLLKGMLQLDADVRLTPDQVLAHPFITWRDQHYTSCCESLNSSSEPGTCEKPELETLKETEAGTSQVTELESLELDSMEDSESELTDISEIDTSDLESISDTESELTEISEIATCDLESIEDSDSWTSLFFHECYELLKPSTSQADEDRNVQSAPPKYCLRWKEDSGHQRETWRQRQLSLPLLPCSMSQEDNDTTSELQQNKEKKGFKRFCSWMRRTFCCCISVDEEEG